MPEDPGSNVKKPMELSSLLEAILIFIGSLLFKAIEYLSAFTHIFHKSSTPPKSFSDLPVDVVGLIVENLDYKQQLKLRKVSKSFRSLVDNLKPACESIELVCSGGGIMIGRNDHSVAYTSSADYDALVRYNDSYDTIVVRDDYRQIAFDDLASTLKNPKLQLDYFEVCFNFNNEGNREGEEDYRTFYINNLQCILEPLNHQLSVKNVDIHLLNPSTLRSILRCLKPGFLKKISIVHYSTAEIDWSTYSTEMDQVALLDQWKQAEVLELYDCFDLFPMEYATHFKRFHIEDEFNNDKFIRIKNFLSELDNFEHCILSCYLFSDDPVPVHQLLGAPVSSNATEEVFRHSIPDSDYYFEFTWPKGSDDVIIVKKKREIN